MTAMSDGLTDGRALAPHPALHYSFGDAALLVKDGA